MPKGPLVHEIFRSPEKMNSSSKSSSYLTPDAQKQNGVLSPSTKKTLAPLPPMQKFGGYKPKILGGEIGDGVVPIDHSTPNNNTIQSPSQEISTSTSIKRRPAPGIPRPMLTNPEPFVIGDKDSPMILSTMGDFDSREDLNSRFDEMHIYEDPEIKLNRDSVEVNNYKDPNNNNSISVSHSFRTNTSDLNQNDMTSQSQTEIFSVPNDKNQLINSHTDNVPDAFANENPVFHKGESVENISDAVITKQIPESEPVGVFIPFPDYDEDERSMDFTEEDPDELAQEEKHKQHQLQQQYQNRQRRQKEQQQNGAVLFYEGEDLSKYLTDDDDPVVSTRMSNTLNPKHNLFKQKPQNGTEKRRNSGQNKSLGHSSVRNFSLADSKYGTSGKVGAKKIVSSDGSGDFESFLNTSQRGDDYETFLRSKHGVALDVTRGGELGYPRFDGKGGEGIWKKLTVRLKHKIQKNGYDMNAN